MEDLANNVVKGQYAGASYLLIIDPVNRWYNHLNPDINKQPWTEEEDRIIIEVRIYKGYAPVLSDRRY